MRRPQTSEEKCSHATLCRIGRLSKRDQRVHCTDDACWPVPTGACEDAGQPKAPHAADQSPAFAGQGARHRERSAWHAASLEGLDDDHAAAAVWAGMRLAVIGGVGRLGLAPWNNKELPGARDCVRAKKPWP